jgi:mycoredoxin
MTLPGLPPPRITVFGRPACEDTAIVRDRLTRLGVPFTDVNLDVDPGAARLVADINGGHQVTPTVMFQSPADTLAEPSLDDLDARLLQDGWPIHRPEPVPFGTDVAASPLPWLTVTDAQGAAFRIAQFRGRSQLAIFFVHAPGCLVCAGYSRQLAGVRLELATAGARAIVVVPGGPEEAARWASEHTDRVPVVADRESRWKRSVAAHLQLSPDRPDAMLIGLDRYLAPRIGSGASDAGGLITPGQAAQWLEFASFECGECATPVGWGQDGEA